MQKEENKKAMNQSSWSDFGIRWFGDSNGGAIVNHFNVSSLFHRPSYSC